MLNSDIWDLVAEMLRGDTATLRACALSNTVTCRSMQRELFRTITIGFGSTRETTDRLVECLISRPSLVSYIRRVETQSSALEQLVDFACPGSADTTSRLAGVHELKLLEIRELDGEALFRKLSACFPALLVLELYHCRRLPLWCISAAFPLLHALHIYKCDLPRKIVCKLDASVLPLYLRTFSYTAGSAPYEAFSPFVDPCLRWKQTECLGVHPALTTSNSGLWRTLRDSGTRLRHLFIKCIPRDPAVFEVHLPSCEARSNTLLSGLETLAVGINRKPQNPGAILRSFGALIDSIPSASLVRFTLLLIYPERSWLEQLDWLPFADALQRLHQELSPGTRKVVRVAIVAYQLELEQGRDKMRHPTSRAAELVPLVQSALQCMKEYADVEVVGGLHRDFREPGGVLTVPHFPMAVYVT